MKKSNKIALIIIGIICAIGGIKLISTVITTIVAVNTLSNITENIEIPKTWQDEAREDDITYITKQFCANSNSIDEEIISMQYTTQNFNEIIAKYESQSNMFAKEFVKQLNNTKYTQLDDIDRTIFEWYIRQTFDEDEHVFERKIKQIEQIFILDGYTPENEIDKFIIIKVKDFPSNQHNGNIKYVVMHQFNQDMDVYTYTSEEIYEEGTEVPVTVDNKDIAIKLKKHNVDTYNNFIKNNKNFIDFLGEYKSIYKRIRDAELTKQAEEEKHLEQLKKSIPRVGMTADEVRYTKWGNPDKINKNSYSWGTTEQWVYNDYGYVYISDGKVTSVSER